MHTQAGAMRASTRQVLVVGAGPAGLLAAGQAARSGASVLLLEKMARPGRKLGLAGNGRGNVSNTAPLDEFLARFGPHGQFLRPAFGHFFTPQLRTLLADLGVRTVVESSGQVYPASNRAADVVQALARWVASSGATLLPRTQVQDLLLECGRVAGVRAVDGTVYRGDALVLATGGASYPSTGSSGDGYRLAAAAGHTIVPIRPALVPLETAGDLAPRLRGLSLRGVTVRLFLGGKRSKTYSGDLLFTHFGLSGPVVLSLSRAVVDALRQGQAVALSLDLRPDLDERALDESLQRDLDAHGRQQVQTLLVERLPRRLAAAGLAATGVPPEKRAHQITAAERKRLRAWLKDIRLEVTGHRSWNEAQVTAGGVDLREVDSQTMASRLVGGLYFAGEVLDLDAGTGGYNLQAAFSSGWLAGHAAGQGLGEPGQ